MLDTKGSWGCCAKCCCALGVAIVAALGFVALMVPRNLVVSMVSGVFQTDSTDLEAEAAVYAERLALKPGMTLCEMGSANGALMSLLAAYVMPGGSLVATSIVDKELAATARAVDAAGFDAAASLTTYLATNDEWAPGLADGTCDALYSRMVIHMIPEEVVTGTYIGQWARAVKPGGRMFMTDHNPTDGRTDGPKRPIMTLFGVLPFMPVVPQDTEVAQITAGGFELVSGPFAHPYYHMGYGAVYTPAAQQGAA